MSANIYIMLKNKLLDFDHNLLKFSLKRDDKHLITIK